MHACIWTGENRTRANNIHLAYVGAQISTSIGTEGGYRLRAAAMDGGSLMHESERGDVLCSQIEVEAGRDQPFTFTYNVQHDYAVPSSWRRAASGDHDTNVRGVRLTFLCAHHQLCPCVGRLRECDVPRCLGGRPLNNLWELDRSVHLPETGHCQPEDGWVSLSQGHASYATHIVSRQYGHTVANASEAGS